MAAPLRQSCRTLSYLFPSNAEFLKQFRSDNLQYICRNCTSSRRILNLFLSNGKYAHCRQYSLHFYRSSILLDKGDNYATPKTWKTCKNGHFVLKNDKNRNFSLFSQCDLIRSITSIQYKEFRTLCQDSTARKGTELRCENKDSRVTENIYTIPNLLTLSRIVLTPVIGVLVVQQNFPLALGLFAFAGVTDWLDGYIARNWKNQMSTFGTALDPLADKILVTVLTATLTMAHLLPVPLTIVIIGRDALLIVAGFVMRYLSLPPPFTLRRYFDGTIPTVQLKPSTLSKVNTSLQLSLVCLTLAAPVFGFVDHPVLKCLWVITAATTLGSGIDYVFNRNKYVKFLKAG